MLVLRVAQANTQFDSNLMKGRRPMDNFGDGLKRYADRRVVLLSATALLAVLGTYLLRPRPIAAQDQQVQVVELKAKKYEYVPSPVHVKAGTKVQLKITAVDHDHGFSIATFPNGTQSTGKPGLVLASPQDCWQIKKGETTTIELFAQTPGIYEFHCCHLCGMGHKGMKSEIVVD
jgi:heme/copper-type cytochrome/quinol oxidase subunit 2